jgi:hypothetical protein
METTMGRFRFRSIGLVCACAVVAAGCGKPVKESLPAGFKQNGQIPAKVYPFAGKITIDGQPPRVAWPDRLLVMLTDPSNPILVNRPCRQCNDAGEFAFGTYTKDDGVSARKYAVTFAVLRITPRGLVGPDQLKNLYNDPDKNQQIPEFNIDHEAPGKRDYLFDLKVAGQEGNDSPGPKALTELRTAGK